MTATGEEHPEVYVWKTSQETVNLLEQSLQCACEEVSDVLASLPACQLDFMEVCCGPDSGLAAAVIAKGGTAERIGLHNKMDLTKPGGLDRARKFCESTQPRNMWLSPVCGPTSPMQNINQRTLKQCVELKKKKKLSRRMAKSCVALAKDQINRGGHVTWEWPRNNYGWYYPEVMALFKELENQGLLWTARLDGCTVGVVAPDTGMPMLKPWLIRTTHPGIGHVLDSRCTGNHDHTPCEGGNRAAASAFYPPKMCRLVAREVMSVTMESYHHDVFGMDDIKMEDNQKGNPVDVKKGDHDTKEPKISEDEMKGIMKALKKLHDRSGHPSNSALVNCFQNM